MTNFKAWMMALIVMCVVMIVCGCALADEYVPKLTVVVETEQVESNLWLISCMDKNGDIWGFYCDAKEWERGDIANLLMWCDEVRDVVWEGYTENIDTWMWLMGWDR